MSNSYSIYLSNQYGSTNTYGFFTSPPISSEEAGQVYANVWISEVLADSGEVEIHITKNYWAWCGTAQTTLAPGVQVSLGNSKLAELGTTSAAGSTFHMYNLDSQPAFSPSETYTANAGCFEIDSKSDFTPDLNFLMGMASVDNRSRMVPTASFEAPRNAKVNIQPVVDYYIAAFSLSQGTVIDFKEESANSAHIDFTSNPGLYGANVIHNEKGEFIVTYAASRKEYLSLIASHKEGESTLEQKVN